MGRVSLRLGACVAAPTAQKYRYRTLIKGVGRSELYHPTRATPEGAAPTGREVGLVPGVATSPQIWSTPYTVHTES